MTILDAATDPALFGASFQGESWRAWRIFLRALDGLALDADDLALYRECTGRETPPAGPAREAFVLCGRRSGKSRLAALAAVHAVCLRQYELAPGERPVVLVCATDKTQARVVFAYSLALLESCPLTAQEIVSRTAETVTLRSGASIEVRSSNFRSIRGVTCAAAVIDEACFLRDEESNVPDLELYRALKPALATTHGRLLAISSPWAQRGLMHAKWRRHFGKDGDTLFWVAPSSRMNPTLDAAMIEEAMADDPVAARSEWQAGWREDVAPFLSAEMVEAVVVPGRYELAFREGVAFAAFLDPSGGAQDSFTCAIAHTEQDDGRTVAVVDVLRERRPPFDPADVVREYAALLVSYGIRHAQADRYAGSWVTSAFAEHGVHVEQSAAPKSDLYLGLQPLIASRRVELLDNARLLGQLVALERKTAHAGRDSVDHPPGGRDDLANVTAGAALLAIQAHGRHTLPTLGPGRRFFAPDASRLDPLTMP